MAGLQYNFFPTDFFYPQPASTSRDIAYPQTLSLNTQKPPEVVTEESVKMKSAHGIKKQIKTLKLSKAAPRRDPRIPSDSICYNLLKGK
ncbi:hypothetical protein E3N88_45215 [Mikania micrantha]|uniref:Uncharacterized protein n=1 Tax=Mikania micrantha TaxID=192012 RepID=A0A5N6LC59_9ASTR|nr:hypothetical protein E3N88_45215 [Mikania micrantha]